MPHRVILAVKSEQERAIVSSALLAAPAIELVATVSSATELERLIPQHQPEVVVLSSELAGDNTFSLVNRLVTRWRVAVIVLLPDDDLLTARRFLKAGALDAIPLSLVHKELNDSLQAALRQGATAWRSPLQLGRIVVFFGTKGGVGTSLLATNVAVALARYLPAESVCLVDLDLQFGAIPMLLNLQPKINLATLAQRLVHRVRERMHQRRLRFPDDDEALPVATPGRS